jgi:hypothetical protein
MGLNAQQLVARLPYEAGTPQGATCRGKVWELSDAMMLLS